jgi:hypothetical protein
MSDQQTPERFKAEMPTIPGVSGQKAASAPANPAIRLVGVLVVALVLVFIVARFALRSKHVDPPPVQPTAQIDVPAPAPDPRASIPESTESNPEIATVADMSKAWASRQFFFRNRMTRESVPSLLVRLPAGPANQAAGYWAFAMNSAYGNCQLEYITDMDKLNGEYGFKAAKHPMVGNPCSHTLFDPLKMTNLPGNVWVRGAIAQGSDLRPPLGIEVQVCGKDILAVRME